jgi:hypothetical protein
VAGTPRPEMYFIIVEVPMSLFEIWGSSRGGDNDPS